MKTEKELNQKIPAEQTQTIQIDEVRGNFVKIDVDSAIKFTVNGISIPPLFYMKRGVYKGALVHLHAVRSIGTCWEKREQIQVIVKIFDKEIPVNLYTFNDKGEWRSEQLEPCWLW